MDTEEAPERRPLVVRAEASPPPDWDAVLADAKGATFCHQSAWGRLMDTTLGTESFHVTARDAGGTLEGVLPLVRVRSRLFGHFFVSMPFLNYGGPVGSFRARQALTAWAIEKTDGHGADLLEFRWRRSALGALLEDDSGGELGDAEIPPELTVTYRKVTVLLPLPGNPETLWDKGLRAKLRSQIRRPMKEDFEVRSGPDQVDSFYAVFARNMRDLGTPVLPKSFFQAMPAAFGDSVVFTTVNHGETTVAAGCGFHFGGEFEITWASSLREYSRMAPNMLLYWRMMEAAIGQKAHTFNFGRCTPGGGTHRFKTQWGGADEPLPWATWSTDGESAAPNPDQAKYRLATSVWSRLPVGVTRIVGPPLARRIP
jgi:FemAB-related protein (PEP-CTERM system-associated)